MKIIAIANHKGGCAKTTTSINLAAGLARLDKQVLLIDMDPQAHSTIGFGVKSQELEKTIYDVILGPKLPLEEVVIPVSMNLDLAPSDIVLSSADMELAGEIAREENLARALRKLNTDYDYVIIDTPPNLGLLTFNSLVACDEILVPVESSFFGLHAISKILEVVQVIKDKLEHEIVIRVLPTIYDKRTNIAREVLAELRAFFQDRLLQTVIHTNVKLRESQSRGVSIFAYDAESVGALNYGKLAEELVGLHGQPGQAVSPAPGFRTVSDSDNDDLNNIEEEENEE